MIAREFETKPVHIAMDVESSADRHGGTATKYARMAKFNPFHVYKATD